MGKWDRGAARHLLMRAGLAFVLTRFGVQELRNPSEWAVFVPSFIADHSPVAVNDLILLHGFLLVLAAAAVLLGLLYVLGCVLAAGLIADIIIGLWWNGGSSDLVTRDIGLMVLAGGLALDPVRAGLENVLPGLALFRRPGAASPKRGKEPVPPARPAWAIYAVRAAALVVPVLALSLVLHGTGGSGAAGTPVDVTVQEWSIATNVPSVKAGTVTFNVTNKGPKEKHEFVILKTDLAPDQLPTLADGSANEGGAGLESIGGVDGVSAGGHGSVTFDLTPGKYTFICNLIDQENGQPAVHYANGMRLGFTVQ